MNEFELNGQTYRVGKLNAFAQLNVSKRIAPIIPTLIPIFVKLMDGGGLTGDLGGLGEVLQPFADGISTMPDEASDFVISTCLSVVQRQNGTTWSPVWNKQYGAVMFEDIDLSIMINLAVRVIRDSLEPFIRGLVTSQTAANPNQVR